MVAVKSHEADRFLRAVPPTLSALLFYGSDEGLVAERAATACSSIAAASKPPGEILRLDDLDFEQDPSRIVTELTTISMFGGRRIVRASASRRLTANSIAPLLDGPQLEGFLVLEAGTLKDGEGLRGLFEKSSIAAAVACYPDEARDLGAVVTAALSPHGLDISAEARQALISRLGADRIQSRSEIEKLALYAHGRSRIELADVLAVTGDAADQALEDIISIAASGRPHDALAASSRAYAAGESPQSLIIIAQRFFQRLHRVRAAFDATGSPDAALRSLRPPLHFKSRAAFERLVSDWNGDKLRRALVRIGRAQHDARRGVLDDSLAAESMLLDIARLGASGSPRKPGTKTH